MIITTKISLPMLKSNLLNRKHLMNRLSDARRCQFILISGPAGYGKTSLAGQWVKRDNLSAAWYSIDEEDNDFDLFFRYFLAALIEADNGLEETMGPLLHVQTRFSPKEIIPPITHALNTLAGDVYFMLDDYHLINVDEIHHALARIIKYSPRKVHFVLISRYTLPRSLARLRLNCDVMEITQEDMKFSEHEAELFFKQVIPLELSRIQIRNVTDFTGGWVAGFQIFGLSLKGKKNPESLDEILRTASREAIDYLMNEVVSVQPEKVRLFLYQTAALDRFNADVCIFVSGLPDAGKILNDLFCMNLFLVSLDPKHVWFRYHQLFSDAVSQWVRISRPGLLEQTRQKAAMWFAKHNHLEDAFHYAFASGDVEFTADLLEDYLIFLFERYEVASSLRWLSRLPREVFLRRPLLRLFECAFKINNMQLMDVASVLPDIEAKYNEAPEHYREPQKILCRDLLVYLKTVLSYYEDVSCVDFQKLTQDIKMISATNSPLAGFIRILIAGKQIFMGDLQSAEEQMRTAARDIFPFESVLARMNWVVVMASVLRLQGRLNQSEKILQEALAFLNQKKLYDTPLKFLLYLPMAWVFFQRNELDKALEYGTLSLRYAERAGHIDLILNGYYLLSRICMAKGNNEEAMQNVQKMHFLSNSFEMPGLSNFAEALFPLLSIRMDPDFIKRQANRQNPDISESFSLYFLSEAMTRAILFLHRGKLKDTIELLEGLREQCAKRNLMEIVLEIDVFLSGALLWKGNQEKASLFMEGALSFSEKQGYIRPFVTFSLLILPLLRSFAQNPKTCGQSAYLNSLLTACDIQAQVAPPISNTGTSKNRFNLSKRELEILRLMSNGYKNRQIADMTYVSINTVKTHVQNIFKKLNVKSRLQAILREKEM